MSKKISLLISTIALILSCFLNVIQANIAITPRVLAQEQENDASNDSLHSSDSTTDTNGSSATINEQIPEIFFKAINPGYTIDKISNVGEMIEIGRKPSDTPISLADLSIGYTNSSGNYSILFEFPENSWFVGETLLLRLASSPESELANMTYTKTIAMKATLTLNQNNKTIDTACWNGKEGCAKEFKSSSPTTLIRNLSTGEYDHISVEYYSPDFQASNYRIESNEDTDDNTPLPSHCRGLVFSEILSYYESFKTEQFIELYNNNSEQILIDGCKLRYKNKTYSLSGILGTEGYIVYYPSDLGFNITKNPTNSNTLELIDSDGTVVDKLTYPNGQRKATSYAFIGFDQNGEEIWKVTYAPTPGTANNYQEFKTCETGKVLNEATGNCVKTTSLSEKICKDGYYLNILTGRCRKIVTPTTKTCKEGYYLNPETGRCRKITENKGASYSVQPQNYQEKNSFIALYAILGVIGLGTIYLTYEFRHEIKKLLHKIFRRK